MRHHRVGPADAGSGASRSTPYARNAEAYSASAFRSSLWTPKSFKIAASPEFKDPGGNAHMALSATGKVNRKDFGLMWNTATEAGPVVSDDIAIELDVELFHKK